jgi:hypothetical protein
MSRPIRIPGFKLDKDGRRVSRNEKRFNVSLQLRRKGSKRIRVAKRGQA